jgi:tRNA 2-(methylsulfanyl)-N6-isopentenyladenosine37 hydroxylase
MLCLTVPSDPRWALSAVANMDSVLADHAHCEMKAAANALSLAVHPPSTANSANAHAIVRTLTDIAGEEIEHFQDVLAILARREVALGPPPSDPYAVALRRVRRELGPSSLPPLVDRLLIAALIEARSCERFKILASVLPNETHGDLREFYERLFAAEARHYRTFVDLALLAADRCDDAVHARLAELAILEGAIVVRLSQETSRATVHG